MGQVTHEVQLVHHPWCLLATGGPAVVEDEHLFHADEEQNLLDDGSPQELRLDGLDKASKRSKIPW